MIGLIKREGWIGILACSLLISLMGCESADSPGDVPSARLKNQQLWPIARLPRSIRPDEMAAPELKRKQDETQSTPWTFPKSESAPSVPDTAPAAQAAISQQGQDHDSEDGEADTKKYQTVALLLPLSGPHAPIGQSMLNAAQLALFSLADPHFRLIIEDTGGIPEQSEQAARRAIDAGARLILGPLLSQSTRSIAPIARTRGITVISFSTDRTVAGNGIFVMGFLPEVEIDRIIRYAYGLGSRRFAVLAPNNAYGAAVARLYQEGVIQLGGEVTRVGYYDHGQSDLSVVVRNFTQFDERAQDLGEQLDLLGILEDDTTRRTRNQLVNRKKTIAPPPFDAILLPDEGHGLLSVAPLLAYFDVSAHDIHLLGTGLWDDPVVAMESSLWGGVYPASDPSNRAQFEKRFIKTYGKPPKRLATLGFDAVALAVVLNRKAQQNKGEAFSFEAITQPSGFLGIDGIFRLKPSGLVERGIAVIELREEGSHVVDPAPSTFQERIN